MVAHCIHIQEYDDNLAQKVKHERFRWHNFQWLEMTTGESLYEEEVDELDEDYLDPSFLHTAAELYNNPDLYYEMQSQLESAHGHAPQGTPGMGSMSGYPFGEDDDYYYDGVGMGDEGVSRTRTFINAYSGPRQQQLQPWSEEYAMADHDDEIDQNTLSPRQYALLMQSMQEPLAMYASTLDSSYQDDDLEGYNDGLNYTGSGSRQRHTSDNMYPMSPGFTTMSGSGGGYQNLMQAASAGAPTTSTLGENLMDPMMLYSPGGCFNPSPTYTYPPPHGAIRPDEHGAMMQMRSPVPHPPPQVNNEGPGGGYGDEFEEVHPASMMSATYPGAVGGGGPPVHMPLHAPPTSRNRQYRPATRQGF